jgi:hypothetical protein
MSMRRALAGGALLVATLGGGDAWAQSDRDRFFVDKVDDEETEDATLIQGSLTLSSFFYRETGALSEPLPGGVADVEGASPAARLFGDLRAQIDARHLKGGRWDVRLDGRARMSGDAVLDGSSGTPTSTPVQSGPFGGNEYEVRELYAVRSGDRTDLVIGRQFVLDLAAVKIDGLRIDYARSETWTWLAFGGLYPTRGSRSVTTDYPAKIDMTGAAIGGRVMPIAGGVGGAYRYERAYGSIGAVVILPMSDDTDTGTLERPRAFATAQGYWRRSPALDFYHYIVVDAESATGAGLTNLSLGVNWRPRPAMRVTAAVNHVDTETLNVQAQALLEDPTPGPAVQNNVEVSRIASDSARLGLSVALKQNRFEISTSVAARRRPEILLQQETASVTFAAAQQAEVAFSAIDRRSFKDLRLGGHFIAIFGLGDASVYHATSNIVRLTAAREIKDGRGELELDASYVATDDDSRGELCNPAAIDTCFGSSQSRTLALGGQFFYRLKQNWLFIGSGNIGRQSITTVQAAGPTAQPAILMTTAFARLSYRF